MKSIRLLVMVAVLLISTQVFAADTYTIDHAHSNITFSVKHMMVSNTVGHFDAFTGTIAYSAEDLANSKISVEIPVAGINTANADRDKHLKTDDFFDAEKFPTITFVAKTITDSSIMGDLTIKGVTKEVTFLASISGPVKGMMGKDVIGINGALVINRQDYGITYNKVLDQGGLALSNDVSIAFSIEAHKN